MEIKNRELHRVAVSAIIIKPPEEGVEGPEDFRYLICRRSEKKKAFPGLWTVPGGGMEVDDYIDTPRPYGNSDCWYFAVTETLKREVREEVNIEIGRLVYLLDITFIRPDGIPAIILSFYCNYLSGEVRLNEENTDYKWATFEEAKQYKFCPGLLGEIEMVDKIMKGEDPAKVEYRNI